MKDIGEGDFNILRANIDMYFSKIPSRKCYIKQKNICQYVIS